MADDLIAVVAYEPEWPRRFEAEQALLERVLAPWLEGGIHHVGSTAIPGIAAKGVAGYRGIQVLRRPASAQEVAFITIMRFDSLAPVKQFAGDDYERAYVIPRARELLSRFDERAQHYEIREQVEY